MKIEDNSENFDISEDELSLKLKQKAYGFLARREHSVFELGQKLSRHGPRNLCDQVIDQLIEQGGLSDSRFAEMLSRARYNAGKGPVKLKHDLNSHQIAEHIIETAMAGYSELWGGLAERVRIRKFGKKPPENFTAWAKQAKFLQQRGFEAAQIGHYDR